MRVLNLVVLLLPAIAATGTARAQAPTLPRGGLLLHGNYCGPGNRAPLPPIDALDAACARHDACTPRGRPASALCNERLRSEAEAIANDPRQPSDLRGTAGFIAFGATLLPSAPELAATPRPSPTYRPGVTAPAPQRESPEDFDPDEDE